MNSNRRIAPSLPQLWAWVTLAGVFAILQLGLVPPNDFWWHVRAGQWIVEHGQVPTIDLFSYTQTGAPFAYQSWLMEVVLYGLMRAGGLPLVLFVHGVTITGAYSLLLRANVAAAGGDLRWASAATLAGVALGVTNWNVRPQTVSVLCFALVLFLVEREERRTADDCPAPSSARALWLLPPLFVLWANMHGGFVLGLALLGTHVLAVLVRPRRWAQTGPLTAAMVLVCSLLATMLTPLGFRMMDYVLGFVRHPITRTYNVEFMPPTVRSITGQFFYGFVVLWVAVLLASRRRLTSFEALRTLAFGALAVVAVRNVVWFGLTAAPALAASLSDWASRWRARRSKGPGCPPLNWAILGAAALLGVLSLPWLRPLLPLPEGRREYVTRDTPVAAVDFLLSRGQAQRVFHSESAGSYMIWASPELPVFIDTRIELYPEAQWLDYLAVSGGRFDWEAILDRYKVDTLLLELDAHAPLIDAASGSGRWRQVYLDDVCVIFEREQAADEHDGPSQ